MDDQPGRQTLVDYLLGRTAEAETEELDERSIADEAFAARLIEVEHDLVDAYVRGELNGTARERFAAAYLATPRGRAKVQFAQALQARAARDVSVPAASRNVTARSRIPVLALVTAAAVVIAAGAFVAIEQMRARPPEVTGQHRPGTHEDAPLPAPSEPGPGPQPNLSTAGQSVLSFVLLPPRRGLDAVSSITVPRSAAAIELRLTLEGNDYPRYRAALSDASTGHSLWTSADVAATNAGGAPIVSITLPSRLLRAQRYTIDLAGVPDTGPAEPLTSYPFQAVLQ